MRYITIMLLLAVCFFGGITYGSVETNHALTSEIAEEQTMEMEPFVEEEMEIAEAIDINEDEPYIYKAAQLMESMFKSVYSMFINLLYAIANLFF